jgi:hypothetical protein
MTCTLTNKSEKDWHVRSQTIWSLLGRALDGDDVEIKAAIRQVGSVAGAPGEPSPSLSGCYLSSPGARNVDSAVAPRLATAGSCTWLARLGRLTAS